MSDTTQIYVRGALKLVAGALALKAGLDASDATALQAALEALAGGVMAVIGFYMSHRKAKPAQ